MSNKTTYLNNIRTRLGGFAYTMKMNGKVNRLGEHISAEDICCGLLNLVFDYELQNANQGKANQIAVDLTDEENGIAVQITTTNTKQKVQNTIEGFCKARLGDRYDTLMVLVMTGDDKFRGWDKITCPDAELRILNFVDLSTELEHKPQKKLKAISDYLDEHFGEPQAASRPVHLLPSVPAPSLSFVPGSRDGELAILEERLRTENAVFLWGLGGIGKTQAAIQLAKKLAPEKGAYFLRYQPPMDPGKEAMRHSILQLHIKGYRFQGADNDSRDAEYAERMELLEREYAGALIIVDNFDRDGVRPEEMLREEACRALLAMNMKLVFTTRNDFGTRGVEIKPLSEADLLALMRGSFTDKRVSDETLLELIRAVQGHTLMVDLMAKTLREGMGGLTPEALLKALRESDLKRANFRKVYNDRTDEYGQAQIYVHLSKVFDLSGMNEVQKRVLTYATLLPANGMDTKRFEYALDFQEQEGLRLLIACGWLQRDSQNILSIHPVVREVCWEELKPTEDKCHKFLTRLLRLVWPIRRYDEEKYAQITECLLIASRRLTGKDGYWNGYWGSYANCLWSEVVTAKGAEAHALEWIDQREKAPHPDYSDLLEGYLELGQMFESMQKYEKALEVKIKALALHEKEFPDDCLGLAEVNSVVAAAYGNLKDYEKAKEYKLKALEICEKGLPDNFHAHAKYYDDVGTAYGNLGDYQVALQYHLRAIELLKKGQSTDHSDLITFYHNLAVAYKDLGNQHMSLTYHLKALELCERERPDNYQYLIEMYNHVGSIYGNLENHQKSIEYHLKAIEILEKVPGDKYTSWRSIVYYNAGLTYDSLGDYQKALEYHMEALKYAVGSMWYGNDQLFAAILDQIGYTYDKLGEDDKAITFLEKALAIWEERLPMDDPRIETAKRSIAAAKQRLAEKEPVSP